MKFTIDLEEKTISIHGPFMVKQIDELFSILNIDDKDTWLIEKHEESLPHMPTYPYIPNNPIPNPFTYPGTTQNPYTYITTIDGNITFTNGEYDITHTNGTLFSGTTTSTWSVQNHDGKSV